MAKKAKRANYGPTVGWRVDKLASIVADLNRTLSGLSANVSDIMGGKTGGCPRCLRMSEELDRYAKELKVLRARASGTPAAPVVVEEPAAEQVARDVGVLYRCRLCSRTSPHALTGPAATGGAGLCVKCHKAACR